MTPATIRFFPRSTKTVNTKVKGFPIPQDIHLLGFSLLKKKKKQQKEKIQAKAPQYRHFTVLLTDRTVSRVHLTLNRILK